MQPGDRKERTERKQFAEQNQRRGHVTRWGVLTKERTWKRSHSLTCYEIEQSLNPRAGVRGEFAILHRQIIV